MFVCLRPWVGFSILTLQTSNASSKNFSEVDLLVSEQLLQRLKSVNPPPPRPNNTRASINNHKKLLRQWVA